MKEWQILLIHQIFFQGMFFAKNIILQKNIPKPIQGNNPEALTSVAFFILFISLSFYLSLTLPPILSIEFSGHVFMKAAGVFLLMVNLVISAFSLVHLKDSWRVGVLENQETKLVTSGIYKVTRNPYFISYLLMFFTYAIFLRSLLLLCLSGVGALFIHLMVIKEENYLADVHGKTYTRYKQSVPRYLLF